MFSYEKVYHLNDLEMSIYNYIIEHVSDILDMSITELSKQTHVSTATIFRFCKKMGFEGYPELKLHLKQIQEISKNKNNQPNTIDILSDNLRKYKTAEFQQKIETIVNYINDSSGIIWLGFGSSAGLCKYGSTFLSGSHKVNMVIDDPFFHIKGKLFSNAVVLVLSVSGEIDHTIRLIESLKNSDCTIISITNHQNSTLAKMTDFNISYYVPYEKINEVDVTTQIPVMYIIESIGKALLE